MRDADRWFLCVTFTLFLMIIIIFFARPDIFDLAHVHFTLIQER